MSRAIRKTASSVGVCVFLTLGYAFVALAGPTPVSSSPGQCTAVPRVVPATALPGSAQQVTHDTLTDAVFFFSRAADGGVRMQVKAADLEVDKTVYADGRFVMQVEAGEDRLAVAFGTTGMEVTRGTEHGHLDFARAADAEWLQIRMMLAGSRALRLFRLLACTLDPATLKKPAGAAMRASDAFLGYLDGDVGAVARLGNQFRAERSARLLKVLAEDEGPNPCYDKYQAMVVAAADEYNGCRKSFSWYSPWQAACIGNWTLQAESAWFQFLACSAVPLKLE